jgi:hypothetical protein
LYSPVAIVTVRPFAGIDPAKVTVPDTGARNAAALPNPMSMPRCWPAAYASPLTENPRSTGPSAGQAHADTGEHAASAQTNAPPRHASHLVALEANMQRP